MIEGGDVTLMSASIVKLCPDYTEAMGSLEVNGSYAVRCMPCTFYFNDFFMPSVTSKTRRSNSHQRVRGHLSPKHWLRSKMDPFVMTDLTLLSMLKVIYQGLLPFFLDKTPTCMCILNQSRVGSWIRGWSKKESHSGKTTVDFFRVC